VLELRSDRGEPVTLEVGAGRWALQLAIGGGPALAVRVRRMASHRGHQCPARSFSTVGGGKARD